MTTDGHGSYPNAIHSVLGKTVRHRTSTYLNNRLEQDHRGIKGSIRYMRGFKNHDAATASVASMVNFGISSVLVSVTTRSLPPTPVVLGSPKLPASRSTS